MFKYSRSMNDVPYAKDINDKKDEIKVNQLWDLLKSKGTPFEYCRKDNEYYSGFEIKANKSFEDAGFIVKEFFPSEFGPMCYSVIRPESTK